MSRRRDGRSSMWVVTLRYRQLARTRRRLVPRLVPRKLSMLEHSNEFTCLAATLEPIGIEPMTYALRARHTRCSRSSGPPLASGSQVAAGGGRWLLMVVRGHLMGTPVMRRRVLPGCGPGAPPLSPIGLTAADLFAGGKVSRADSRVR